MKGPLRGSYRPPPDHEGNFNREVLGKRRIRFSQFLSGFRAFGVVLLPILLDMPDTRGSDRLTFGSLDTVGTLKVARVELALTMLALALWVGLNNAGARVADDIRADLRPREVVRDSFWNLCADIVLILTSLHDPSVSFG